MPQTLDPHVAAALGFPKLKYAKLERERRWLVEGTPPAGRIETIDDLYVAGTRLRLRSVVPDGGGARILKLTRKADVDPRRRLVSTLYLSEAEFALFADFPGMRLRKRRHHLPAPAGIALCVDHFEGRLAGLRLAEAEFDSDEAMAAFVPPAWARREVTEDRRYGGAILAREGLPATD